MCHARIPPGAARRASARSAVLAILSLALLTGCTERASRWTGTVTDSAGITIVRNTHTGIWPAGEEWTLEEELAIGAEAAAPAYQFGSIGGIAVDSRGRVFVLDDQAQEIRVFSAEGVHEATVGRRGEGPGEFTGAQTVLMGPGDTLLVPDRRSQRMNRFSPEGSFLGATGYRRADGLTISFRANSSGRILEQLRPIVLGRPASENPEDVMVRWTPAGTRADTLTGFPSGEILRLADPWSPRFFAYAPEPLWDVTANGGLILGVSDGYRLEVFSPDGAPVLAVVMEHTRPSVTQADIAVVRSHMAEGWSRAGAPPAQVERLQNLWTFGDTFPAFTAVYSGPRGSIWVQEVTAPSAMSLERVRTLQAPDDCASDRWDVFSATGRFYGVVTMPARFRPALFRDDRLYGIRRDEFDVQQVVRFRVRGDSGKPLL
ncbi:MAG: 6-bladed beta-propeller [Gemmatimonadetes bacterium]|nr:6-bladed beta-propeller [Gemmatimonadota bacterium]